MRLIWEKRELDDFASRMRNTVKFETYVKKACQELACQLRAALLQYTPVVTGELISGWGGHNLSFQAVRTGEGFKVELINRVPYALYVNDGHYSHNQFGGPYVVSDANRKIKTVYPGGKSGATFVYGHFFVEKSVVTTEKKVEDIVYPWIDKWFRWCCGG